MSLRLTDSQGRSYEKYSERCGVEKRLQRTVVSEALCFEYGVSICEHVRLTSIARRRCKEVVEKIQRSIEDLSHKVGKNTPGSPSQMACTVGNATETATGNLAPRPAFALLSPSNPRTLKRSASYDEDAPEDTPTKPKRMRSHARYRTPFTPTAEELFKDVPKTPAPAILQPRRSRKALDSRESVWGSEVEESMQARIYSAER